MVLHRRTKGTMAAKAKAPQLPDEEDLPDLWSAAVNYCKTWLTNTSLYFRKCLFCFGIRQRVLLAIRPTLGTLILSGHPLLQAHAPIPDDAWEYQIRKALNDAAYNGLEYVPYCTTMPIQPNSENVAFMWVRTVCTICSSTVACSSSYDALSVGLHVLRAAISLCAGAEEEDSPLDAGRSAMTATSVRSQAIVL